MLCTSKCFTVYLLLILNLKSIWNIFWMDVLCGHYIMYLPIYKLLSKNMLNVVIYSIKLKKN